jgi:predicted AlkP superfamily phosphohydrolase/phosphomutase
MTDATGQRPKVLVVGLDGATFDNLRPWIDEGRLPNLKRLVDGGVHGALRSTIPPVTAPAWTSFMTGKNPGKHGLYNFMELKPGSYELRYTNARTRLASTLWEILGDSSLKVGVINVPMTYPPQKVNGYMISGLDAPDESTAITEPRELYEELHGKFGQVSKQFRYMGFLKTDERRDAVLKTLAEIDDHYHKMTKYLLETHPVDVCMVVFTSTDTIQHFFYHYLDPKHPQHDAPGTAKYGNAIRDVYERMDKIIGDLTSRLGEEATVVLMSDHGFRSTSSRFVRVNHYLEQTGFLKRKRSFLSFARPLIGKIDALLRGNLSSEQKGKLASLFPALRQKWESQYGGLGGIDWKRTKAFCNEVLIFPPSIWINQKGVQPQGIVEPGREYEEVVKSLTEALYALKDPVTGAQLISRVYRKEEAYSGAQLAHAPDLTLACWEGITFVGKQGFGEENVVEYQGGQPLAVGDWSGAHSLEGIMTFEGQAFRKGLRLDADIVDLVPTLLYLLGVPIPDDMDGRVLLEAFTEEFARTHGITTRGQGDGPQAPQRTEETYSQDESDKVAERLRGLGYIG